MLAVIKAESRHHLDSLQLIRAIGASRWFLLVRLDFCQEKTKERKCGKNKRNPAITLLSLAVGWDWTEFMAQRFHLNRSQAALRRPRCKLATLSPKRKCQIRSSERHAIEDSTQALLITAQAGFRAQSLKWQKNAGAVPSTLRRFPSNIQAFRRGRYGYPNRKNA